MDDDDQSTPNAFRVDRDDDPTMTNLADIPAQLNFNEPAVSLLQQKSADLIYPSLDDITLENVYPQKYSSARNNNNEMASVVRSPLANVSNKNTASPVAANGRNARSTKQMEKNFIGTPIKTRGSISATTPVTGVTKSVSNTLSTPKKSGVTVLKKPMTPVTPKMKTPVRTQQQPQSTLAKSPGVKTRRVSASMNVRVAPSTPKQNPGPAAPSTPRRSISKLSPRSSGSFPNYMPTPLRKQSAVRKMRASTDVEPPKIPTSTRSSLLSTPVKHTTATPSRIAPRSVLKSASKTKPSKMRKSLSRKSVSFSHNLEINCFFSSKETTEEIREQRSKLEHLLSPSRPPNSPGVLKRRSSAGQMSKAAEGKEPVARKLVFSTANDQEEEAVQKTVFTPSVSVTSEKRSTPKNSRRVSMSHKRRRSSVCSNESLSPTSSPAPEMRQAKRRKLLSTPEPSTPTARRKSSHDMAKSPSLLASDLMLSPFSPRRSETTEMSVSKPTFVPNPFQSDRFSMSALPDFSDKLRTTGANPFKPVYNLSNSSSMAMEQDEFEFNDDTVQPKKEVAPIVYVPPEERSEKTQKSVEKEEPKRPAPASSTRPVRSSARVRGRSGLTRQTISSAQKQRQQQVKEQEQPKETKVESTTQRQENPNSETASTTTTRVRRRVVAKKTKTVDAVETESKSADPVVQQENVIPQEPEKSVSPSLPDGITIDTLDKLRVVDLRPMLQKRGLATSGLKKDLVDRLKIALMQEITPQTNKNEQQSESNTDATMQQEAEEIVAEPVKTTTRRRRRQVQTVPTPSSSRPKRSVAARRRK